MSEQTMPPAGAPADTFRLIAPRPPPSSARGPHPLGAREPAVLAAEHR